MSAENLLHLLEGTRKRGVGQWSARCPAHDDKGPSLSIKELPDGRLLLHCFASCSVEDVLTAIGLDMHSLFPPRPEAGARAQAQERRRLLPAGQALELLHDEAVLVAVAAGNIAQGVALTDHDRARVMQAAGRIAYLRAEVMV